MSTNPNQFTIKCNGKRFFYPKKSPELLAAHAAAEVTVVNSGESPIKVILVSSGIRVGGSTSTKHDHANHWIKTTAAVSDAIPPGDSAVLRVEFPKKVKKGAYAYTVLGLGDSNLVVDPYVIIK